MRTGKIRLLVLLLMSMAVGGAATYGFLGRQQHAGSHKPKPEPEKKKEAEQATEPIYVDMGPFLVNLSSQDRLRYLRAEVTLGVAPTEREPKRKSEGEGKPEAAKLPPGDDAKARDVIVQVLSRQAFDRLRAQGPDGELRKSLQDELARQLTQTKVVNVLFTSFVMQ
jgi:flagellar basal body-associated protein FliL